MHILLTALSVVALVGCFITYTRCQREADYSRDQANTAEQIAAKLQGERARVTVAERELDALRRELRKLSGKFYASQRVVATECPTCKGHGADPMSDNVNWLPCSTCNGTGAARDAEFEPDANRGPFPDPCLNWALAKEQGPASTAAKCECLYCMTQRADRARVRAALVPKGAQATAATAKLNAGKP